MKYHISVDTWSTWNFQKNPATVDLSPKLDFKACGDAHERLLSTAFRSRFPVH
jgi:hypothetical protein